MKRVFVRSLWVVLACVCVLSLVACGAGIRGEDAKATIRGFFDAVEAEDYAAAAALLHPSCTVVPETVFGGMEETVGLDFQAGIEIKSYTGMAAALYDSSVDGATYALTMKAAVGDQAVEIVVELVKNDEGYGITNVEISR